MNQTSSDASSSSSRLLTDGLVLFVTAVMVLLLARYTGLLDAFLDWANTQPGREVEKLLIVGLVTAVGLVIFAARRWQDARQRRDSVLEDRDYWRQMADLPQQWLGLPNPDTLTHTAVDILASQTSWEGIVILAADPNLHALTVRAASEELPGLAGETFPYATPIIGPAHTTKQPQLIHDLRDFPLHLEGHAAQFRSCLAMPLLANEDDQSRGVLLIHSSQSDSFDRATVRLWRGLSQQLAQAWEQAHLTNIAQQRLVNLNVLHQIAARLSSSKSVRETAADVLNVTMLGLGFRGGRIALYDQRSNQLITLAEQGLDLLANTPLPHELDEHVFNQGHGLALGDITRLKSPSAQQLQTSYANTFTAMNQLGIRSYVAVPLARGKDEVLGVLSLFELLPHELNPPEQALFHNIADQLTTAVYQYRLEQNVAFEQTRLRALLESNHDGVILVNLQGELVFVNETVYDLLGLPINTAAWQGQSVTAVLAELEHRQAEFAQMMTEELARIETGNEPPSEGEFSTEKRHLHWFNQPVMGDQETLGRLLILRDVTQERLLEQLREDLIHTAIHDLRNPIAAIAGCLNMLTTEADPKEQEELLKIMRRGTHGLQELVNTILDISQLENRQMVLNLLPVNFSQLVGDVLNVQQSLAKYYDVSLHNLVPRNLPQVIADPPLIKRVLQNLVDNALKFTPAGGDVTVSTAVNQDKSKLFVTVHDTGPGVPPHLQAKIFDRFTTGRSEASGNGLGLTFCKMAIEEHGETIEVLSSKDAGTMFTFSLSLAPSAADDLAAQTNGVETNAPAQVEGASRR